MSVRIGSQQGGDLITAVAIEVANHDTARTGYGGTIVSELRPFPERPCLCGIGGGQRLEAPGARGGSGTTAIENQRIGKPVAVEVAHHDLCVNHARRSGRRLQRNTQLNARGIGQSEVPVACGRTQHGDAIRADVENPA